MSIFTRAAIVLQPEEIHKPGTHLLFNAVLVAKTLNTPVSVVTRHDDASLPQADLVIASFDMARGVNSRALETISAPILLLPSEYELSDPPFSALLVPVSRETRREAALALGFQLGLELGLPIDVVHVTSPLRTRTRSEWGLIETYTDEFHHEIVHMAREILIAATPMRSARERATLRNICHIEGSVIDEITRRMSEPPHDLMIIDWSGSLAEDRAIILRKLISSSSHPLLLVRRSVAGFFRLRVGRDLFAA
jgi:hypothetical protein